MPVSLPTRRLVAAALTLAALALPASAAAAPWPRSFDGVPGVVTPPPPGQAIHDEVNFGPAIAFRAATVSAAERTYTTADGKRVRVQVSNGYPPDPARDQALVDFLGGLLHGAELDGLRVYVATPPEIPRFCGGDAAACYSGREERMFVVGEASGGGFPTDYVIAHEYGHHVANNRRNPPFRGGAFEWGPKRWASYEGACRGVRTGKYSLNYNSGYYRYPGEAFAEAYAYYHYRNGNHPSGRIGWEWHPGFKPNAGTYAAIRADLLRPWLRNTRVLSQGSVRANGSPTDTYRIATPLDGTLSLRLSGPPGADLDLLLLSRNGRVLRRSAARSSNERIGYLICGPRLLRVRVLAAAGRGGYRLTISKP